MATLHESSRTDWDGKPFWGLVQQDGPWRATKSDYERARMKDRISLGGGKAAGGRGHAGHGEWLSVFTPYQINATAAPPPPSGYAMRSVMMDSVDMKRQTKMGRVKTGLTLHARTPMQTGHKMGNASEEVREMEAGDIMPPVRIEAGPGFTSTHHIMESPSSSYETGSEGGPENIMHFGIPIEQEHVPSIKEHTPFFDQALASLIGRDDERKEKYQTLLTSMVTGQGRKKSELLSGTISNIRRSTRNNELRESIETTKSRVKNRLKGSLANEMLGAVEKAKRLKKGKRNSKSEPMNVSHF